MEAQLEEAKRLSSSSEFADYDLSDPDQEGEYRALKRQHDEYYDSNLGGIFRRSFVISFYSYVELWLEGLCRKVKQKDATTKLALEDLDRRDSLQAAARYLDLVKGIKLSSIPEWAFLRELKRVRNCLVHADAVIEGMSKEDDKTRLWTLVEQNTFPSDPSGITVSEPMKSLMEIKDEEFAPNYRKSAQLVILPAFCFRCVSTAEKLFASALKLTKIYP
jgi:hypothetical protein